MKKRLKKAVAVVLTAVMAAGLTACGGENTSAPTSAAPSAKTEEKTTEAPAADKTEAAADKQVVNFWHSMGGRNGDLLNNMVAAYNASQDKVEVVAENQGDYYSAIAKAQTAIAAGNGPDILQTGTGQVSILAKEEGILENLVPYMEKSGMSVSDFNPTFITGMSLDPSNKDMLVALPMGCSTPVLFCNMDLLEEAGAEVPETWDELSDTTKKMIDEGKIEYGFTIPHDPWYFWMFVAENGTKVFSEDGMKLACVDDGTGTEAMQMVQDMCKEKVMYFGPVTDSDATCRGMFLEGKCAFYVASVANLGNIEGNSKFNYSVQYVPRFKTNAVPSGGNTLTMLAEAKNKEAAWDFLYWLYNDNAGIATFAAESGYLPCSQKISEMPAIKEKWAQNPNCEVAYSQLKYGNNDHMVMQPNNGDIANNVSAMMEACFYDYEDVTEQMNILKEEAEEILADLQ